MEQIPPPPGLYRASRFLRRAAPVPVTTGPGTAMLEGFQVLAAAVGAQPVQRDYVHGDDGQYPAGVGRDEEADAMLARLHDRPRHGHADPEQTWPEADGPRILALARRDPETQTVILIL